MAGVVVAIKGGLPAIRAAAGGRATAGGMGSIWNALTVFRRVTLASVNSPRVERFRPPGRFQRSTGTVIVLDIG